MTFSPITEGKHVVLENLESNQKKKKKKENLENAEWYVGDKYQL